MRYSRIVGVILWIVGFIGYLTFLSLLKNVGAEAFWYGCGASLGVLVFYTGIILSIQRQ